MAQTDKLSCERHHDVYFIGKPMTTQHYQYPNLMISRRLFLLKSGTFHLSWKKLNYIHFRDFLIYECQLHSKQLLTPPQRKIIVTYRSLNHRLVIEIGWWLTIPISRDDRVCHFWSYNVVEVEAHFVFGMFPI